MSLQEFTSEEVMVIRKNLIGQGTTELHYRHSHSSLPPTTPTLDHPQLAMYELLRSLVRNQLKLPFQTIKQTLHQRTHSRQRHLQRDLQIAMQNLKNVSRLVRQRLLLEGFLQLKGTFIRRMKVESVYYNVQNVARLNMAMVFAQNAFRSFLKWQGFGRLFQHVRGMKLSKITLSKIEIVSGDLTAKEFEDFKPFLGQRRGQIQAIHSYIIQRSSDNGPEAARHEDSQELRDEVRQIGYRENSEQQQSIERHFITRQTNSKEKYAFTHNKHTSLTEKFFRTQEQDSAPRCSEFTEESTQKRQGKKMAGAFAATREMRESGELGERVMITQRKGMERQGQGLGYGQGQHLFVVRDYRFKATPPSDYIKVPLTSEDVKIVQISTGRKNSSSRKRVQRAEAEVEREICQNCRFCVQTRERQEIMHALRARLASSQTTAGPN